MKDLRSVCWRFLKVIYFLFLLLGLLITLKTWFNSTPSFYQTYSYKVVCDNGKVFDPTSKPIDRVNISGSRETYRRLYFNDKPTSFDENQVKSECEYGTVWGWSSKLQKNYQLQETINTHVVRTQTDQIRNTIFVFIFYYFLCEVVRRTLLYIFLGKNFLTLKSNTKI